MPLTPYQDFLFNANQPRFVLYVRMAILMRNWRGVLYKLNKSGRGRKELLVIPSFLRRNIIESCHDTPTSGHFGREKTLA